MDKSTDMVFMSIKTEINMMVNGLKIKKMVQVFYITKVEPVIMDNGLTIKHVIMELLLILIKMFMMVLTFIYLGNFLNGKKHGDGIYHYKSGGKYKGEWIEDRKQGYGIMEYTNKDKF